MPPPCGSRGIITQVSAVNITISIKTRPFFTAQSLTLPNATVQFTKNVNDLGVLLGSRLTMADHISALSRSWFFQLRSIKQSLTLEATTHAFVSSWLDYCNSVLAGVSGQLLHRLQVIQNAAVSLVTGVRKYERMTPVLPSLQFTVTTSSTTDHF